MKQCMMVFAIAALAISPAIAEDDDLYRKCITMADTDPDKAYDAAVEWRDFGGGAGAEHCMAIALAIQGDYARAAELLEDLARRADYPLDPALAGDALGGPEVRRADLLAQAGNAWLIAGETDRAYSVFSDALEMPDLPAPVRGELLIDRATADAERERHQGALDDLNEAFELLGQRADILTYRAAAQRGLGALSRARADIDAALALAPQSPEALFERASLNLLVGNYEGAILDWTKVRRLAPGTPAAQAAAINIARAEDARDAAGADTLFEPEGKEPSVIDVTPRPQPASSTPDAPLDRPPGASDDPSPP